MSSAGVFSDGSGRPRLVWRIVIYVAGLFFLQTIASAIVTVPIVVWWMATRPGGFSPQVLETLEADMAPLTWVIVAASALPTVAVAYGWTWVCRKHIDKRDLASLGLRQPPWGWPASLLLGLLAGMLPIGLCVGILFGMGQMEGIEFTNTWMQGAVMVPVFILMAFFEEITCRGYLMQNFIDQRRTVLGAVLVSVIFWLMHSMNPHVWTSPAIAANLFLAGVMLTMAYLVSGELWFPTAAHFGWNFCQGVVFGIPVSGITLDGWTRVVYARDANPLLTGGDFGLEGSVVAVVVLLVEIAILGLALAIRGPATHPAVPGRPFDSRNDELPVLECID
jgi:membrane protease YdiL (CAAX protease family)